MKARAVAGGNGSVSEAMAVTQQQERFGAQVFQRERGALGEPVIFGKCGEEALGEQRGCFKFVAADGKREDGNVDGSCAEQIEKDGRDFFNNGEMSLGKFARERREDGWQEIRSDCVNNDAGTTATYTLPPHDARRCRRR